MIKLYFSTVKILAQMPTHISAVAAVLLITKTFTVKERERGIAPIYAHKNIHVHARWRTRACSSKKLSSAHNVTESAHKGVNYH